MSNLKERLMVAGRKVSEVLDTIVQLQNEMQTMINETPKEEIEALEKDEEFTKLDAEVKAKLGEIWG